MLKLTILTPERRLLEGAPVEEVTIMGSEGQIQVLPGHAPMVGSLEIGEFSYQETGGRLHRGLITAGFFEVRNDELTVTAETLELQGEIDVNRAKRAQKAAEDALKEANLDESAFGKYQLKLQRALVRQQIAARNHGAE